MSEIIKVRAVPNAPKTACAGAYGDGVKVKVAAPASDGKANARLVAFLAKTLGIPRRNIGIVSGETSRDKLIEISGVENVLKKLLEP